MCLVVAVVDPAIHRELSVIVVFVDGVELEVSLIEVNSEFCFNVEAPTLLICEFCADH